MDTTELSKIDSRGETALIYAIRQNMEKVCELLIPKMSDESINHGRTTYNDTALILAARKNMDKVYEMLIPKMSQLAINELNHNQDNVLNAAAWHGLDKVCELLIPKMSQLGITHANNKNETALSLAQKKGFQNICDLLTLRTNELNIEEAFKKGINQGELKGKISKIQAMFKFNIPQEKFISELKFLTQESIKDKLDNNLNYIKEHPTYLEDQICTDLGLLGDII